MRVVVDAPEPVPVDVAVDLRRRQRGMAEQLLNRPQVGAALEQVRCERVAQTVRVRRDPPERARVEPPAAHGEKQRVLCGAFREQWPSRRQVARDRPGSLLAERDDALLAALAADEHVLLLEVDVAEVEGHRLGTP